MAVKQSSMFAEQNGNNSLETILMTRRSFIEDSDLQDGEKEFLRLVGDGDIVKLRNLLEKQGNALNVNCCDCRGHRALDIAVSLRDEELVLELLSGCSFDKDHLEGALLKAVDGNDIELVKILVERCENTESKEKRKCMELTPIMSAAIKENVEILQLLIHRGYQVEHPHVPGCVCLTCFSRAFESLQASLLRINSYRALASPIYIVSVSEDPILTAFKLSHRTSLLAKQFCEHQNVYHQLSEQCAQFAADFLDQCRNTEEVEILLVQKKGLKDTRNHRYSRLCLAVQYKQKKFISHPTCQQVLYSTWVEGLNSWKTMSLKRKVAHVLKQVVLTPIVSTIHALSPQSKIIEPMKVPLNQFIYSVTSYFVFLLLLQAILFWDRRQDIRKPAMWPRFAADAWILGYILDIALKIWSMGFSIYFRFWWQRYDLAMYLSFAISELLAIFVYLHSYANAGIIKWNRMDLNWYHPLLIGEGIFACSTILAFCRVTLWYQMFSKLGPLGTSLTYMLNDVLRFFMIFFVLMFSFAMGINSIYRNYEDSVRVEGDVSITQQSAFISLRSTFKTLFWTFFGMGKAEFADIVVSGNFSSNSTVIKHSFTESVGYVLWGLYHLLLVIILLNMLIAMMAESYERVQGNADMEWKFARCTLWLSYFDNEHVVSPPFNLLPSFSRLAGLIRWSTKYTRNAIPNLSSGSGDDFKANLCCTCDDTDSVNTKEYQEKYEKLLLQLRRRYLDWRKKQQRAAMFSEYSSSYLDLFEKIKREVLSDLKKRHSHSKVAREIQTDITQSES